MRFARQRPHAVVAPICTLRTHSHIGSGAGYHAAENKFERFREFLELISRFEFDFRRCGNFFLNDLTFWCVQSSITHNVALHVHVLQPVCTHTIPFRMLWCLRTYIYIYVYVCKRCSKKNMKNIFIRNEAKNMKTLWKVAHIVCYNWVLVAKDKSNHPVAGSLHSVPQ